MSTSVNQRVGALVNRPYVLAQSAIPVCLAPNGTVATDGIVTLGTALPTTFSGGIWLRFPANAIVGGAAGMYWAVMSSTTQGQVYTNFADTATEFIPFIPGGPLVAAVGSNAAYTQTTAADITLVNVTLPAGALNNIGELLGRIGYTVNNSAGSKAGRFFFGAQLVGAGVLTMTTVTGGLNSFSLWNAGQTNSQISRGQLNLSTNSGVARHAVNTANSVVLALTANLVTAATDFMMIDSFVFTVNP